MKSGLEIQGNLIASDLLPDLLAGDLKGQAPEDFGFEKSDKLADEVALAWGDAKAFWAAFGRSLARLPAGEPGTTVTREQWVIPLLRSLGYGPVYVPRAAVVDGLTYAISHRAGVGENQPPIHVVGCRVGLEERPPRGKPRLSAHGLVQEFLNRTEHLWAIATNGLRWRLLRDSTLMTRLTYIEFDLEQILNGENFAEFGLFYRLFHRSRMPKDMEDGDRCLLEFYHQESLQQGGRVRDRLRDGVERALKLLGNGFLRHRQNEVLRDQFANGALEATDYYRQLLLLIYRLLFLMVAESRNLLLAGDLGQAQIYRDYYSIERLRALAEKISWQRETFQDLWQGLRVTFRLFDEDWHGEALGLSPLNGDLFGSTMLGVLDGCAIDNHYLLQAVRELSLYEQRQQLRRVNYGALDVEELGSVYESLLDFHPQVTRWEGIYQFELLAGNDRKTSGSYYTPPELVGLLVKNALEPVIRECLATDGVRRVVSVQEQERALLGLKVCDPACGSGHFLLAAARQIGKELARLRTGEIQPGGDALRQATRDAIQHCIYGVDLNPLAVDLCKVGLWIEGFCQGMPLNFLDHRIKWGNSLVGVFDLEVLRSGIPGGAYKPVTGDDKALASGRKRANKAEQVGQLSLEGLPDFAGNRTHFATTWQALGEIPERTPAQIRQKQVQYLASREDAQWWNDRAACNLWTAAFFTPITAERLALVPTTAALARLMQEAREEPGKRVGVSAMVAAANSLAEEQGFFHWPLEFPEVFEQGGFDCVLGNPPWERIKLQEKEFFASRDREIATAQNKAARERLLKTLPQRKPDLAAAWASAKHDAEAQGLFIRESSRFLLTSKGDINTYAVFAEVARSLIAGQGRSGIIVPTGIATDNTTKNFFRDLVRSKSLYSLISFENEAFIFSGVHHAFKFCILSIIGTQGTIKETDFIFFCRDFRQLDDQQRHFNLSSSDIGLINPNTLTCPIFRTRQDAELTKKIYQQMPVLENEAMGQNPWGISFMTMFHMSNDSNLFKDEPQEGTLPLYEAKMFFQCDHRHSTYEGATDTQLNVEISPWQKQNPNYGVTPRYWVDRSEVESRLVGKWNQEWLIAFRCITNTTNKHTTIFSLLPKVGVGNNAPLVFTSQRILLLYCVLLANFNSLVFDFVARQKLGGTNFNYFILKQLPVIPPECYTQADINFIAPRILELTYTAWDIKPFAQDMWRGVAQVQPTTHPPDGKLNLNIAPTPVNPFDQSQLRQLFLNQWQANWHETPIPTRIPPEQITLDSDCDELPIPPFIWNDDRRAVLQAEIDAYYAHLYGLTRDELRYILDPTDVFGPDFPSETFRVLKNDEIKQFGEYRTQQLVLAAWDRMGF